MNTPSAVSDRGTETQGNTDNAHQSWKSASFQCLDDNSHGDPKNKERLKGDQEDDEEKSAAQDLGCPPVDGSTNTTTTSSELKISAKEPEPSERELDSYQAKGWRLFLILAALLISIFCQALDDTIIATAIPRITDQFHRLNDVGWYASAYFTTNAAFQLFYGKLYQFLPLRWVFMAALLLFEVGSLIAAVAPNSATLIAGRAVAGTGAAGITSGAMTIMAHVTPVHQRPVFVSLIGAVYGVASVAGPIVGGAFAQTVTWRWNFYINLPIGGISALVLLLSLNRLPPSAQGQRLAPMKLFQLLDPVGTLVFVPSIICLLMALQWGGIIYAWSSGRIITLLVIFTVLLIVFVLAQILQPQANVTIPIKMAKDRSMSFGAWFAFCQGAAFNLFIFYLPIYFQAIKHDSPIRSGVDYLPLILVNTAAILAAGFLTSKIGYYVPWVWASSVLMSVGAALLTLLRVDSTTGQWVGYQLLFAVGSGFGLQQPFITAQTVLPLDEISTGIAVMLFFQLGGGGIFVSAAQSVFTTSLVSHVGALGIPGLDPHVLVNSGATELRQLVSPQDLPAVLLAYNTALVNAFRVGLIMACVSTIGAVGMKWVSVKKKGETAPEEGGGSQQGGEKANIRN